MVVIPEAEKADVVIVNTCSFIDSSKEESIGHILEVHQNRGLREAPQGTEAHRRRLHVPAFLQGSLGRTPMRRMPGCQIRDEVEAAVTNSPARPASRAPWRKSLRDRATF